MRHLTTPLTLCLFMIPTSLTLPLIYSQAMVCSLKTAPNGVLVRWAHGFVVWSLDDADAPGHAVVAI